MMFYVDLIPLVLLSLFFWFILQCCPLLCYFEEVSVLFLSFCLIVMLCYVMLCYAMLCYVML
jgi:hypothetical protein